MATNYFSSNSTATVVSLGTSSLTGESTEQVPPKVVFLSAQTPPPSKRQASMRRINKAVYAHIRAVRALGRKRINTEEIAEALSLPVEQVNRAIHLMKKKGVRVVPKHAR
jgi:hypothetical protein